MQINSVLFKYILMSMVLELIFPALPSSLFRPACCLHHSALPLTEAGVKHK